MINYDDVTKENIKELDPSCWKVIYHLYRISINQGSGFGKTNALLNIIKQQNDDDYNINDKFICMLMIQMKQNTNILLKKHEKFILMSMKIQRLLLLKVLNSYRIFKQYAEMKENVKYFSMRWYDCWYDQ